MGQSVLYDYPIKCNEVWTQYEYFTSLRSECVCCELWANSVLASVFDSLIQSTIHHHCCCDSVHYLVSGQRRLAPLNCFSINVATISSADHMEWHINGLLHCSRQQFHPCDDWQERERFMAVDLKWSYVQIQLIQMNIDISAVELTIHCRAEDLPRVWVRNNT